MQEKNIIFASELREQVWARPAAQPQKARYYRVISVVVSALFLVHLTNF